MSKTLYTHLLGYMEFFFLTQNVSLEVLVLIILMIILSSIGGYSFYTWIRDIQDVLQGKKQKRISSVTHNYIPPQVEENTLPETLEHTTSDITPITREEPIDPIDDTPTGTIDTEEFEKLVQLVSGARTLIARNMIVEAQTLIVEGLSIQKNHRELNLMLGSVYEQQGQYEKAEYVYKDLGEIHPDDTEILEKLANVLLIEKKNIIAYELYKKIHTLTGNTENVLYMLSHISHTLGESSATLEYAKQYILEWPKNTEIISLLATTQITLGLRKDAIETYKNLKNLTPYSSEISEIIQKLLLEEELASNFGNQNQ